MLWVRTIVTYPRFLSFLALFVSPHILFLSNPCQTPHFPKLFSSTNPQTTSLHATHHPSNLSSFSSIFGSSPPRHPTHKPPPFTAKSLYLKIPQPTISPISSHLFPPQNGNHNPSTTPRSALLRLLLQSRRKRRRNPFRVWVVRSNRLSLIAFHHFLVLYELEKYALYIPLIPPPPQHTSPATSPPRSPTYLTQDSWAMLRCDALHAASTS